MKIALTFPGKELISPARIHVARICIRLIPGGTNLGLPGRHIMSGTNGVLSRYAEHRDLAFTGLEAAIVLVAFVVVAAVFSYVVLGTGFFTTQLSQRGIYSGVEGASSTLQLVGTVYGTGVAAGGPIDTVNFSVSLAPGGTAIDFSKVIITYSNASLLERMAEGTPGSAPLEGEWTIAAVPGEVTADQVLEKGEQFTIMVKPPAPIYANDMFDIAIQPPVGALLSFHRTAPASIQLVNILY